MATPEVVPVFGSSMALMDIDYAVSRSLDQGRTWSAPVLADAGAAGYSVVQPLADGALGLIFEAGDYGAIIFVRIEPGDRPDHPDRQPGRRDPGPGHAERPGRAGHGGVSHSSALNR